jgi:hypothetical protein
MTTFCIAFYQSNLSAGCTLQIKWKEINQRATHQTGIFRNIFYILKVFKPRDKHLFYLDLVMYEHNGQVYFFLNYFSVKCCYF